jgi:hypothetical protein
MEKRNLTAPEKKAGEKKAMRDVGLTDTSYYANVEREREREAKLFIGDFKCIIPLPG